MTDHDRLMAALRWRALLLQTALALYIGATLIAFGAGAVLVNNLDGMVRLGAALVAALIFSAPTLVLVLLAGLVWVWRAHANLRDLGIADLRYSPVWATGSWLVPFANFVVPRRAMRELWNRSAGEDQYQAEQEVTAITGWWSCLLGGALFQAVFLMTLSLDSLPGVRVITSPFLIMIIGGLGMMLLLVSAVMLFQVVRQITRSQKALVRTSGVFD
ncbi:DUF4328 domain-containing protein [Novosphingobium sp.]|uniref:DUF4328 domain-containing protein n=1 Tax=Novosphingobium sp. TaxID=1874826 RepID=UPI0026260DA6|nr:DUF4328 domain-containing protein [Novosphingobium sp.]